MSIASTSDEENRWNTCQTPERRASDEEHIPWKTCHTPERQPKPLPKSDHQTRKNAPEGERRITIRDEELPDCTFLARECRNQYLEVCVPLYQAAMEGNWKAAKDVVDRHPNAFEGTDGKGNKDRYANAFRIAITSRFETALHVAAAAKRTSFVEELVKKMNKSDLALKDKHGNTAFCFAATSGVVKIAKTMVTKNENLPTKSSTKKPPLYLAIVLGHKDMVSYLYKVTKLEELTAKQKVDTLVAAIGVDMYDIALQILENDPNLATARDSNEETALHVLARKPQAFACESFLGSKARFISSWISNKGTKTLAQQLAKDLWRKVVQGQDDQIYELIQTPSNLLLDAAEIGNVGFLSLLIRSYPDLVWTTDKEKGTTIFHVAVLQRQESVFNLIHDIGAIKDLLTLVPLENDNTILHLAATLPPPPRLSVLSGVALQMQRELLWFKEVEKIVRPSFAMVKNRDKKTPRELFTSEHQKLKEEGERWMKETSTSCMVVATLITTVVFAAAFTVPGGNNSESGRPVFFKEKWFTIFVLSDVFGLFFSVFSIVMFLSILTSRFAEEDFLVSLPAKLIFGLAALFASIACMLVAFAATFFLVYNNVMQWVPIVVISISLVAAISHFVLHFKVWFDAIRSTFFSGFLFKPGRYKLY